MQQAVALWAKASFQQAAKNFGWLLAERLVRFGLGTVVGFVVARHLGPARLGSLSYGLAVVTLLAVFAGFGLDAVIKRDLLQAPERTAQLLADGLALRLLAGLGAALGLLVFMVAGPGSDGGERSILLVLGLLVWQPALLMPELWLQARLLARYSAVAQTAALAVSAGLRLWLVFAGAPLVAFAAASVVEALLAGVFLHYAARRAGLHLGWFTARLESMRRLAAEAGPLALASLAIVVYLKIDEVMLRQLVGPAEVGIYAAATRLTEIWYFLPAALASSLLPALLRARARGEEDYRRHLQRYYDLNAVVAYTLAVPVAFAAPWLVRLAYGAPFAASSAIVVVHIWSSVFVFLGVARGQWLVNERFQRFYLVVTLVGALANIALNFVFIPRWGGVGAAWATVIAQAAAAWLSSFCSREVRPVGWMQTRALLVPVLGWRYFLPK